MPEAPSSAVYQLKASLRGIEAATAAVAAIAAEAEALQQALDPAPDSPGGAGDDVGDGSSGASPGNDGNVHQKTASTSVENTVRTIQGPGRTPAKGWDGDGEPDDPAGPLLFGRWLGGYQGTRPLPSDEQVEFEITARLRARAMGLATRVVNQAVERHGLGLVVGAVLFVHALPETARVRCKGGLLASLLRRDAGQLTPATFHRRPPADLDLGEAEALGIAACRAPSHQPHWIVGRWHDTRHRKGERIRDPRRCLEAFAAKLEREQGHRRWVA